jgi:site-specific recombinase XerD
VNPPTFSGENVEIVARYERHLGLQSLKQSTISLKLWNLYSLLKYYNFKPADILTKAEIEDYVIHRRKTRKPKTVHNDIVELRMFFKWLIPDNDYFEGIKSKSPKNTLPIEQLVTPTNVTCLVNACQSQRDRAIIMLLWDSAARLNEALELKVGSIHFDNNGGVVIVNGKTGMRRIRLIDSVPDLQNWINMHPYRDNHDAPLFVTTRMYEGKHKQLDKRTVQNMVKTVSKRSGIQKNIHPHAFRHARLTNLAKQGFNEMELRIIAGWENNSDMPAVYIHLSGADVEKKILEKNGLVEPDEEIKTPPTKPKMCPRCKTKNSYDSQYCMICSAVLDPKKAKEIEDREIEKSNDIEDLKKQVEGQQKLLMEFSRTIQLLSDREVERNPENFEPIRPDKMPDSNKNVEEIQENVGNFDKNFEEALKEEAKRMNSPTKAEQSP